MNWHFLNPLALWAVPVALAPVIFHFLFRKKARVLPYGDLRFLRAVLLRARPKKRLEEWLILLCRMLALLCLFYFFSRPVLHWGPKGSAGDSLALVVVLDSSYSMQSQDHGRTHWDQAAAVAEKTLKTLSEVD